MDYTQLQPVAGGHGYEVPHSDALAAFPFGSAGRTLPAIFTDYARILHRAEGNYRWSEVCAYTGQVPHALMQWDAICHGPQGEWNDQVRVGELPHVEGAILASVLSPYTAERDSCFFAYWDGWAGIALPATAQVASGGRTYALYRGPLSALTAPGNGLEQTPNLLWPTDISWMVVSEIDFDSTLIGANRNVIDALLENPELESWRVRPHDSLAHDGDSVNHRW